MVRKSKSRKKKPKASPPPREQDSDAEEEKRYAQELERDGGPLSADGLGQKME